MFCECVRAWVLVAWCHAPGSLTGGMAPKRVREIPLFLVGGLLMLQEQTMFYGYSYTVSETV